MEDGQGRLPRGKSCNVTSQFQTTPTPATQSPSELRVTSSSAAASSQRDEEDAGDVFDDDKDAINAEHESISSRPSSNELQICLDDEYEDKCESKLPKISCEYCMSQLLTKKCYILVQRFMKITLILVFEHLDLKALVGIFMDRSLIVG